MKFRKHNWIAATISLCVACLPAISTNGVKDSVKNEEQGKKMPLVKSTVNEVVDSTERFGLDLFQKLSVEKKEENCFISPASVAIALNFAMSGAAGSTRQAMAKGLRLANPETDTTSAFHELLDALISSDNKVELNIANAIFVDDKFKLNASFALGAKNNFQSEIKNEDFSNAQTLKKINAWVAEKTKNHIPTILSQLAPDAVAVLLNAIYFKGTWTTPFLPESTKDGDFHLENGGTKKVSFMNRSGKFSYLEGKEFQAVMLPYGASRYEAYVFLPSPSVKLSEFQKRMTSENWNKWTGGFETWTDSHLFLPRFHVDYKSSLNDTLKQLGFAEMYSNGADFSPIHTPPPGLKVGDVIHKTTLDVDEKGTVATAATAITMFTSSMRVTPTRTFNMIVDRPFIFAIRDSKTGFLLFFGSVFKPELKADQAEK
jgi:serpin B